MNKQPAAVLRPDFEAQRAFRNETRSAERLTAHYAVEARLAMLLSAAPRTERSALYGTLYRELFASVPDHPQHRADRTQRLAQIERRAVSLLRELRPTDTYVEIGCGDALLAKAIARGVASSIGIDVTDDLLSADAPATFRFVKSDGVTLALTDAMADLVFSNQLMEHLHVDDALDQLREIMRILKPGGRYVCCTPNRLTGPHDISVYFTAKPTGFHLREYDHRSLSAIFRRVGFQRIKARLTLKGRPVEVPVPAVALGEWLLERLPATLRAGLARQGPVSNLMGLTLVGIR